MTIMDDEQVHTDTDLPTIPSTYDRDDLEYDLIVRQEPKQARMCGVGTKADRRPIDPPPVVQLRVIDKSRSRRSSSPDDRPHYIQSFLQNPYYFMYASLASPDRDEELHLLKDGKTRCTTGSVVSSLYHLKDPEADPERGQSRDAGFFVFPDLSVRTEGTYRLKLTLFEVIGANVHHCKSIFSAPFYVYTAKKFPGMEESTNLSCALADQGIKIRIRKDVRVRKRNIDPHWFQPVQRDDGASDASDDETARDPKRSRTNEAGPPPPPPAAPLSASASASGGTWGSIDPALPPTSAPPPAAPAPDASPYDARAFNPTPASASSSTSAPGSAHPEYHPPQPHQHAPYMPPPPHPGGMYAGAYGWGPVPPPHPHAQGYGAYPGYDHHRAHPYGAPAMHYGVPPPYAYYDQHGQYVHPPPQPQQPAQAPQQQGQQQQLSPQDESPKSASSQVAGQSQQQQQSQQQGRGKDGYPPPPASSPGMVPPPTGYVAQDYAYGRPPPASAPGSSPQGRPYHPSPGPPPPQSAPASGAVPGVYSPSPQGHMGHYMPAHPGQHAPYAYAQGDLYQHGGHPQQAHAQQPQQWPYAPAPFGAYGRPAWGPPPGDPYAYAAQAGGAGGGYVRPGPEENGRRSPPVPSISSQARAYNGVRSSPTRVGNTNTGAEANTDRIQLAPLRAAAGAGADQQFGGALGKKNPLSIGSIISDES